MPRRTPMSWMGWLRTFASPCARVRYAEIVLKNSGKLEKARILRTPVLSSGNNTALYEEV